MNAVAPSVRRLSAISPIATPPGGGLHGDERANANPGHDESERATTEREQHTFRQQLANDASTARAERRAKRDLGAADESSRQQ